MRLTTRNPVQRVREFLLVRELDAHSDAELLSRFVSTRDDDAFTALVRLGPSHGWVAADSGTKERPEA